MIVLNKPFKINSSFYFTGRRIDTADLYDTSKSAAAYKKLQLQDNYSLNIPVTAVGILLCCKEADNKFFKTREIRELIKTHNITKVSKSVWLNYDNYKYLLLIITNEDRILLLSHDSEFKQYIKLL